MKSSQKVPSGPNLPVCSIAAGTMKRAKKSMYTFTNRKKIQICPPQAVMGCEDCVLALLDHSAFTLCRDTQGRTPLHLAASCGHAELLGSLAQAAGLSDPLDCLLDFSGYTPTHWAAYHGERAVCRDGSGLAAGLAAG